MTIRSQLRNQALERDGYRCRWPKCDFPEPLEMCHLQQLSQGGPDTLSNVVMLCKTHHGVLDNRVQNGRREAIRVLLETYLANG